MFRRLRGQATAPEVPPEKRKVRTFVFEQEIELPICPWENCQKHMKTQEQSSQTGALWAEFAHRHILLEKLGGFLKIQATT